jgi:ribosomal 50S subunit-associated protein YjgA (DUF615 family)
MLAEKKFSATGEEMAETEAYFVAISKSNYKNGIEKLYDRHNHCITLKRNNIESIVLWCSIIKITVNST